MIDSLELLARAGGGGSGGGGGGAGIILLPIIAVGAIISWYNRRRRIKRADKLQDLAAAKDATWNDDVLMNRAREVFMSFQRDWATFNFDNMKSYLTPRYYGHIELMLTALKLMGRRNDVDNVHLEGVTLFGVRDQEDDEKDGFNVEVRAWLRDILVDTNENKQLFSNIEPFTEIWHFEREQGEWMLDQITQINKDKLVTNFDPVVNEEYQAFAIKNNFYYNADFGRLLMPHHGLLFSSASFELSDLNHHVLGLYKDILIQFFEYQPLTETKAKLKDHLRHLYKTRNDVAKYTIAHATLPKSYENIIVDRRNFKTTFDKTPKGYTKVSLEWPEFNKKYNVYATDMDKVTSLELLHPAFMGWLADLPFEVSLEIVGTDLYLFTTDDKADYDAMLTILNEAFAQMKL